MTVVPSNFYNRTPLLVAPNLLGKILVRRLDNVLISGRIVEVEAYVAFTDEAAHGFIGKTKRNESLFKGPGHAYVHSMHMQNCIDIVTQDIDVPSGVLLRALEPLTGIEYMKQFRGKEKVHDLTTGPGKLTQALQISKTLDGIDVTTTTSPLYVIDDGYVPSEIVTTERIGISKAKDELLRFYIKDNEYVSRKY